MLIIAWLHKSNPLFSRVQDKTKLPCSAVQCSAVQCCTSAMLTSPYRNALEQDLWGVEVHILHFFFLKTSNFSKAGLEKTGTEGTGGTGKF